MHTPHIQDGKTQSVHEETEETKFQTTFKPGRKRMSIFDQMMKTGRNDETSDAIQNTVKAYRQSSTVGESNPLASDISRVNEPSEIEKWRKSTRSSFFSAISHKQNSSEETKQQKEETASLEEIPMNEFYASLKSRKIVRVADSGLKRRRRQVVIESSQEVDKVDMPPESKKFTEVAPEIEFKRKRMSNFLPLSNPEHMALKRPKQIPIYKWQTLKLRTGKEEKFRLYKDQDCDLTADLIQNHTIDCRQDDDCDTDDDIMRNAKRACKRDCFECLMSLNDKPWYCLVNNCDAGHRVRYPHLYNRVGKFVGDAEQANIHPSLQQAAQAMKEAPQSERCYDRA